MMPTKYPPVFKWSLEVILGSLALAGFLIFAFLMG